MSKSRDSRVRHAVESFAGAFLFLFQYMPVIGPWYGFMSLPFATYIFSMLWANPDFLGHEVVTLLFSEKLMFGRVVAVAGFIVFLIALTQFVKNRGGLVTSGLYSFVRHPQYFGLIVMALGISMMAIQHAGFHPDFLYTWLILVFGYVLLASYEERYLLRDSQEGYTKYKQRVSFILPIPHLPKVPEILPTMITILIIAFLLTLLRIT